MKNILIVFLFYLTGCYEFKKQEIETDLSRLLNCNVNPGVKFDYYFSDFPIGIQIDNKFTRREKSSIKNAMDEWNDQLDIKVFIEDKNSESIIRKDIEHISNTVYFSRNYSVEFAKAGYVQFDYDDDYFLKNQLLKMLSFNMTVNREYDRDALKFVIMHELGHVLTLGHNNNPDSLMYYAFSDNSSKKDNIKIESDIIEGFKCFFQSK